MNTKVEAVKWDGTIETARLAMSLGEQSSDSVVVQRGIPLVLIVSGSIGEMEIGDWLVMKTNGELMRCRKESFEINFRLLHDTSDRGYSVLEYINYHSVSQ